MDKFLGRCAAVALALLISGGAQAQVVISQVYGGGGNSGATLKSDFIELRNNGTAPVDLSGWSVQYASSAGTSWARTALTGTIPAGGYYLIKQADGAGGTVDLPTPDAIGTLAMAGTAGKVALVNNNV
jgi:predicted extracellular nuclease